MDFSSLILRPVDFRGRFSAVRPRPENFDEGLHVFCDRTNGGVIVSDIPLMRIDEEKDELLESVFGICCSRIGRVNLVTNEELRFGG